MAEKSVTKWMLPCLRTSPASDPHGRHLSKKIQPSLKQTFIRDFEKHSQFAGKYVWIANTWILIYHKNCLYKWLNQASILDILKKNSRWKKLKTKEKYRILSNSRKKLKVSANFITKLPDIFLMDTKKPSFSLIIQNLSKNSKLKQKPSKLRKKRQNFNNKTQNSGKKVNVSANSFGRVVENRSKLEAWHRR